MKLHLESSMPMVDKFIELYQREGANVTIDKQWGEWTYSAHFHAIVDVQDYELPQDEEWWTFAGWLKIEELETA